MSNVIRFVERTDPVMKWLIGSQENISEGPSTSGVDPVQADTPTPGAPATSKFEVNQADEGLLLYDLLGTSKVAGNIIYYTGNYNVAIKETRQAYAGTRVVEQSGGGAGGGGKGGGGSGGATETTVVHEPVYRTEEVVVGYRYYLTWAVAICLGPADVLYTVIRNNEPVWTGELLRSVVGSSSTISIPGMGNMTFYFGTDDQTVQAFAPRRLCYALFSDCQIGEYNRCPNMKFVVGKRPVFAFNAGETIDSYDYNPAHAIWYIKTQMAGLPESYMDEDSFSDAADALSAEGAGISILFNRQQSVMTYLESVLRHIDGVITYRGN